MNMHYGDNFISDRPLNFLSHHIPILTIIKNSQLLETETPAQEWVRLERAFVKNASIYLSDGEFKIFKTLKS